MKPPPALLHTLTFLALACGLPLAAQEQPKTEQDTNALAKKAAKTQNSAGGAVLPEVVIVASRSEQSGADVPASVTVLDKDASVFSLATSMRDYARYEPGVSVPFGVGGTGPAANSRAGTSSINIRGLDGNRVLMTVDGIRQADQFTFGGSYNVGRDFVDVDSLKQVEILKNAASSLYGSDALAGVVSFTTIDPEDLLAMSPGGLNSVARLTTRYDSADSSWSNTISMAQRAGNVEFLLHYTRRDGHEVDNRGAVQPDPSTYSVNNWLAKMVWKPSARHRFELTGEYLERSSDNDIVSARRVVVAAPGFNYNVNSLLLNDDLRRMRFSLEHKYDATGLRYIFDTLTWNMYYQLSETPEHQVEDRDRITPTPQDRLRIRDYLYRQDHIGTNFNFTKAFKTGALNHTLAYGTQLVTSNSRRVRDATEYNFTTNTVTNVITPDTYPLKDMPDTRTSRVGVYIQDEIAWGRNLRHRLTPGLRAEYYDVATHSDPLYLRASAGRAPQDFNQFALAPKLSYLFKIDEEHSAYFQYSNGFRNPSGEELNATITNTAFGYQTVPNPSLKKETSNSFEIGVRRKGKESSWNFAGYYNHYENFINSFMQVGGTGAPGNPIIYQSTNLASAEIYGLEFKGETTFGFIHESLGNFGIFTNAAYSQGWDGQNKQPLASVDPFKLVTGLRYRRETWQVELISTCFAHKGSTESTSGGINQFKTPSALTVDLVGRWQLSKNVSLSAGLYNLTNQKYWLYQNVRGVDANNSQLDRYTQPGINGRVALTVIF
ncbi:TonB-dependent hemoglobin/transferrin/lactoferrin family receptor [Prosthecobacter sp.]|uniref:TonB-dependent hemoglobin/transferrin/lactoferrin family receptor n=1 Tax=Prosthecobacter sp. TaxID=1965333 RepID=UPI0024871A6C|nr:TonB-dependent hemoglobin/transferrin/lactoferrin family receptor [Prosthecobacter sp.]MDI1310823.1 TonB-dependent hemoglobin/transferrin/lactoferrin family receptor [Prosthecobacter sp.]